MATRLLSNHKKYGTSKKVFDKLTDREQQFCLEMIASDDYNPTEAARKVGYKNAKIMANRLIKRPKIARFLGKAKREREERTQLTSDDVWSYLHRVLYFDPAEIFTDAGKGWWWIKSLKDIPKPLRQMIESIEIDVIKIGGREVPRPKIKFVSKGKALEIAARHAIPQQHEHKHAVVTVDWDQLAAPPKETGLEVIEARIAEAGS